MPGRTTLIGSMMLFAASTCDECLDTKTTTTEGTYNGGTTSTTPPSGDVATLNPGTGLCELDWFRLVGSPTGIASVCFDGEYGPDMIADVEVSVPCDDFFGSSAPNDYEGYENDLGSPDYMVQATGVPWLCNVNDGAGTWLASFPPGASSVCEDYTLDGVSYVVYDAYGLLTQESGWGGPDCPYVNQYGGYYMALDYDKVWSGPTDCSPGSATFKLGARAMIDGPGADDSLWLTPLAEETARFPERAWLRKVEVLDWGTATRLHVAAVGDRLSFDGGNVSNGRLLAAADGNIFTFAVGASPMSAMFGTSHYAVVDDMALPTVKLTWSCQQSAQSPHYLPIPEKPFVADLPASTGFGHRLIFWVDWANRLLRIAPEGRFEDAVRVPLMVIDEANRSFSGTLPAYELAFSGQLHKQGGSLALTSASVTVGGTEFPITDRLLPPL